MLPTLHYKAVLGFAYSDRVISVKVLHLFDNNVLGSS